MSKRVFYVSTDIMLIYQHTILTLLLELSDSCDLLIIMIVSNNRAYHSMLSYYCDKLCMSVLSQKKKYTRYC